MKQKFLLLSIILLSLFSCQEKAKKYYYDSGELHYEEYVRAKDSLTYLIEYYKNGTIKRKGYGIPEGGLTGYWEEFYRDGFLKWSGFYDDGTLLISETGQMPDYTQLRAFLDIKGEDKFIEVGKPFQFRIYIEGVHPLLYQVTVDFLEKIEIDHEEDYPYSFTLSKERLEVCKEGLVPFDFKEDCNSLYFIAHLPNEEGLIIFNPDQPTLAFSVPIKEVP